MEQRILHEAENKLSSSHHLFGRTVRCDFRDGVLRIFGKVPTFYLKQTAQSLIQGISGVERVENSLTVANPYGVSSDPSLATG